MTQQARNGSATAARLPLSNDRNTVRNTPRCDSIRGVLRVAPLRARNAQHQRHGVHGLAGSFQVGAVRVRIDRGIALLLRVDWGLTVEGLTVDGRELGPSKSARCGCESTAKSALDQAGQLGGQHKGQGTQQRDGRAANLEPAALAGDATDDVAMTHAEQAAADHALYEQACGLRRWGAG